MGRKNSKVRRSNDRGRLQRRQRGESPIKATPNHTRVQIENLVLPDGQCTFQSRRPKARFDTPAKAKKALEQAQLQRERTGSGHVEKRYYACPEGGCGGYHLTSREAFDEDLWKQRRALAEQKRAQS